MFKSGNNFLVLSQGDGLLVSRLEMGHRFLVNILLDRVQRLRMVFPSNRFYSLCRLRLILCVKELVVVPEEGSGLFHVVVLLIVIRLRVDSMVIG